MATDIKKVVLAYSGGLDTSIILKWLQNDYGCEVVTFTADLGQGEELEPAREKAELLGIKPENIFIEDLREEFVRDFVFPMFRANALYEGAVSARHLDRPAADRQASGRDRPARPAPTPSRMARPARATTRSASSSRLCAEPRHQGDRAVARMGAEVAHRADRIRREAPDPDRQGQARRGAVLGRRQPAALLVRGQGAGGPLARSRRRYVYQRTIAPEDAPDKADHRRDRLREGRRRSPIDGEAMSPATLLTAAERARPRQRHRPARPGREPLRRHEVARRLRDAGRHDPACGAPRRSNRSRWTASAAHLKDELMPRYAELIYNGFWFAPEREMLQALIDKSQEHVDRRRCALKLYKGNVIVVGRESPEVALLRRSMVTFEDDAGAYDQKDAAGFIKLNALRLRLLGRRREQQGLMVSECGLTGDCSICSASRCRSFRRRWPIRAAST